ncbi:MAG: hypothetical protein GY713_11625 [Actinomycetia bacterium]|nr:hypothetical protein [Actinomycetes bacterium]
MPPKLTYPGVYVQEIPSGVRPIAGVSTATTMFVGAAPRGPIGSPTLILGPDELNDIFGHDPAVSDLTRQVRLFFENGGTTAYVMRIADGASAATVTLQNEAGQSVLDLTAADQGVAGEDIRAVVRYDGASPESTFTLEAFRWDRSGAAPVPAELETFTGLSMDPMSSRYAPTVLTQSSRLLDAAESGGAPVADNGYVQSGLAIPFLNGTETSEDVLAAKYLGGASLSFDISVDGGDAVTVDLAGIDLTDVLNEIERVVTEAHAAVGRPGVTVTASFETGPAITVGNNSLHGGAGRDETEYLRITSDNVGDIKVMPGAGAIAGQLRLGGQLGGLEVSAHANRRPAPTGLVTSLDSHVAIGAIQKNQLNLVELDPTFNPATPGIRESIPFSLVTTGQAATTPLFAPGAGGFVDGLGGLDGVAAALRTVRDAINDYAALNAGFNWRAEVWGARLAILPTGGSDNRLAAAEFDSPVAAFTTAFQDNVRMYTLGVAGSSLGQQVSPGGLASDGTSPQLSDYAAAYDVIDREVDIFNLLVLPQDNDANAADRQTLWGPASSFCQRSRAFLLMDPPGAWGDHNDAINGTGAGNSITDLRIGLVKDHSAVYFPRITINEDGLRVDTDPAGAVAGLMARIDTARGVWKAPAGTEADIRGIVGVTRPFSDMENGVMNPRAINTIRQFPTGIVSWGSRTMDGDNDAASEYKYVPIRRLLLYIEESLYRGLQWTVFEPNGEDLWAAIRLNVGNFLRGLYRQGAFAGTSEAEAFQVACDATTTTPTDRNLGIVNVHVGVATLKPAEFVVLSFRQLALPEQ